MAISDILTRKELPEEVGRDMSLYVGCIASASQIHEYEQYLRDAGFKGNKPLLHIFFVVNMNEVNVLVDIVIVDTQKDLNAFKEIFQDQQQNGPPMGCCPPKPSSCCGSSKPKEASGKELLARDFNEWAGKSPELLSCTD